MWQTTLVRSVSSGKNELKIWYSTHNHFCSVNYHRNNCTISYNFIRRYPKDPKIFFYCCNECIKNRNKIIEGHGVDNLAWARSWIRLWCFYRIRWVRRSVHIYISSFSNTASMFFLSEVRSGSATLSSEPMFETSSISEFQYDCPLHYHSSGTKILPIVHACHMSYYRYLISHCWRLGYGALVEIKWVAN